jgi:hypothetical protein
MINAKNEIAIVIDKILCNTHNYILQKLRIQATKKITKCMANNMHIHKNTHQEIAHPIIPMCLSSFYVLLELEVYGERESLKAMPHFFIYNTHQNLIYEQSNN